LMLSIVRDSYAPALCGMLVALALLGVAWRRAMRWDERPVPLRAPAWNVCVLAPVMLLAVRGNASGKPIGVVDAFTAGSVAAGYLALNGPFSIAHSVLDSDKVPAEFMPWDAAVRNVQAQVFSDGELALDPEYPLLRARPARPTRSESRPNVVVLLLESWDGDVVDVLRAERGLAPLGVTPNFDALSREGVLFTNCYAAGQRSTHGLLAVLSGIPTLPGMPYLGHGVEQSRLSYLGRMALAEGYSTYFLQGSKERSFRIDAIARLAGFQHYLGRDAIVAATGNEAMADWGAWDADLLSTAHELFSEARQPFLGFAFTTSTHLPFQTPAGHASPYPDDSPRHAYWNSVHYADSALGDFFARARDAGYFANTIFVLVSDHRSGIDLGGKPAPELHHIPCLVLAPGLAPRVERGIASQLDVLPSIVDLASWTEPYAALGHSLFDASGSSGRGALCVRNDVVVRIEDEGWLTHDLSRRLDARALDGKADLGAVQERLLAADQVIATTLRTNRVVKGPSASR
ncbi:MAG TPA: LTA synthase family protein, partial [Planctomycetota bacterium]|nr:LTA synthase family protein [Planctomycetota bacterium]